MGRIFDGGPAYPRPASIDTSSGTLPDGDSVVREQTGMSLRDLFAAHAIAGVLASYAVDSVMLPKPADAANRAYGYADAMLARRDMPTT
jgi:hypothetical protein